MENNVMENNVIPFSGTTKFDPKPIRHKHVAARHQEAVFALLREYINKPCPSNAMLTDELNQRGLNITHNMVNCSVSALYAREKIARISGKNERTIIFLDTQERTFPGRYREKAKVLHRDGYSFIPDRGLGKHVGNIYKDVPIRSRMVPATKD